MSRLPFSLVQRHTLRPPSRSQCGQLFIFLLTSVKSDTAVLQDNEERETRQAYISLCGLTKVLIPKVTKIVSESKRIYLYIYHRALYISNHLAMITFIIVWPCKLIVTPGDGTYRSLYISVTGWLGLF